MTIKEIMERERWETEEFFVKGNINVFDETEVFDKDAVFRMLPFPAINGVEAFKQFCIGMRQGFSDFRWKWDEVVIEGNTAVQRYTIRMNHTGTGPMFPVPPTGKEVVAEGCVFYHLKNGKIVEFIEYANLLGLLQQIGVIPPMEQGGQ